MFAQREQGGAFGLFLRGKRLPFGAAHRAEEDGVGGAANSQGFFREGLAIDINCDTAHAGFGELELEPAFFLHRGKHAQGFGHHFRTNAVARQHRNIKAFHRGGNTRAGSPTEKCKVAVKPRPGSRRVRARGRSPLPWLRPVWGRA